MYKPTKGSFPFNVNSPISAISQIAYAFINSIETRKTTPGKAVVAHRGGRNNKVYYRLYHDVVTWDGRSRRFDCLLVSLNSQFRRRGSLITRNHFYHEGRL